jgi:thiol-disulfide isomerase/thioredoxin
MKNIYLGLFLCSAVVLNAQVVFEASLSETFKKAKERNKPVFIEYYNSDCSVCMQLGNLLREDTAVSVYYNTNFISYAMNTYDSLSAADSAFMERANLHFESVPVLLYFDKDKNFLHYSSVKVQSEAVINEAIKAVSSQYNSAGLKSKYESGDRTVRTLYAYADFLMVTKNDALLKFVTQELYASFVKSELPTKKSYVILKNVVTSTENGFFQYWINNIENLKNFETGAKEGTETSYLQTILLRELSDPNIKNWDNAKKEQFKGYILKLKITDNPAVFFEQA